MVGGVNHRDYEKEEEEEISIADKTLTPPTEQMKPSDGETVHTSPRMRQPNLDKDATRARLGSGMHKSADALMVQIVRTSLPEKRKRRSRALSPTPSPAEGSTSQLVSEDHYLNSTKKRLRLGSKDKSHVSSHPESPTPSLSQSQTTPLVASSNTDHTPSPVPNSPYRSPYPSSRLTEMIHRHTPSTSSTPLSTVGTRSSQETTLIDVQRVQNPAHTQPIAAPPPYHDSLLHQHQQQQQQQQQSSPTPSELYRQQQESLAQQLEILKQKQVQYHQYGASPQQWYHLQMQQQHLLQQKNIMELQVHQLTRQREAERERQRQKQLRMEEEAERQRRQLEEEQRQRQLEMERHKEEAEAEERRKRRQQLQIEEENQRFAALQEEQQKYLDNRKNVHQTHSNEQLWKPISQTTPPFHPTPPPSQSPSAAQTPPPRHLSPGNQSVHRQPSPQRHPMQSPPLSSLMRGSPSLHNIESSPEVHSGYSTPTSSEHRVSMGNTPSMLHLHPGKLISAMESSQSQHQLQSQMIIPQQMMLTQQHPYSGGSPLHPYQVMTPPTYQMQAQQGMGVALPGYKDDGSGNMEALLRQQEHQRILQQQHQLRMSQDPGFLLQQGMIPYQQHGRFVQQVDNPLVSATSHIGFMHEQNKLQQSPTQGLHHAANPLGGHFQPTHPLGNGVRSSPYNHLRLQ